MKEFLDVNWVLVPTKEVIEAIETMSIHNNYADIASRKVFTEVRGLICAKLDRR